jgi:hypothetical protein
MKEMGQQHMTQPVTEIPRSFPKNEMKSLARKLGLRRILKSGMRHASNALFHMVHIFRHDISDRVEVRINGKEVICDVFPCKDNRYIALIGRYGRLDNPDTMTCVFESGEVSKCIWIDDYPHRNEGEQVLICLFPVPEADKRMGATSISLQTRNGIVLGKLTIHFNVSPKKYHLTATTLVRNEERILREWIEYCRAIGVEHFYIYDNRSLKKNKVRKLLEPYTEQGIVTLLDWDYLYAKNRKNSRRFCQRGQMHHCLYKYGHLSTWMFFIDVDEFVFPVDHNQTSVLPLLEKYDHNSEVAALQFKMIWFGNSGHKKVPEGLIIENYTHRAADVVQEGREKCCVRPDKVELMLIHNVKQYLEGSVKVIVPPEQYRINHYNTLSAKRRRHRDEQLNVTEDTGMQKFVPMVCQQLRNR